MSNSSPKCDIKATAGGARPAASLLPSDRKFCERRRGRTHHAEPLSRRRFHYPPGMYRLDALGAQFFQPADFRLDIVGFNVEVHAARVAHNLHLDLQAMLGVDESLVGLALAGRQLSDRHAESAAPELGGGAEVLGLAINDETAEFAFVHRFLQICRIREDGLT
jgi:hypothetical protein